MLPRECDPYRGDYSYDVIADLKKLSSDHHRVGINRDHMSKREALEWAAEHCKAQWSSRNKSTLLNDEEYRILRNRRSNPDAFIQTNWLEDCISFYLSEEIALEIDNDILEQLGVPKERIANSWFFFKSKKDALKFQLRWGV